MTTGGHPIASPGSQSIFENMILYGNEVQVRADLDGNGRSSLDADNLLGVIELPGPKAPFSNKAPERDNLASKCLLFRWPKTTFLLGPHRPCAHQQRHDNHPPSHSSHLSPFFWYFRE